jgi:glycosyltransferase involved in cell wall biosynthesis
LHIHRNSSSRFKATIYIAVNPGYAEMNQSTYKVLVNATTITVGGGVQAAISFLEYAMCVGADPLEFTFAVSEPVYFGLPIKLREDKRIHVFGKSPAGIFSGRKSRQRLIELEKNLKADIVYSIGFPSYVKFIAAEIGRYTNPWEICAIPLAWKQLSLNEKFLRFLKNRYRIRMAGNASYFETQTMVAKNGIVDVMQTHPDNVFISPNSINDRFGVLGALIENKSCSEGVFKIFCLAAAHKHKNIEIIPSVAMALNKLTDRKFKFILTLPNSSSIWFSVQQEAARQGVNDAIENHGPLSLDQCLIVYRESSCVFLPTLAEVFSATYLEAMAMQVPILTSDLDFAKEVCLDAALYFDPLSAVEAAGRINQLIESPHLSNALIEKGMARLSSFPDSEAKHIMLIDWILRCARSERGRIK